MVFLVDENGPRTSKVLKKTQAEDIGYTRGQLEFLIEEEIRRERRGIVHTFKDWSSVHGMFGAYLGCETFYEIFNPSPPNTFETEDSKYIKRIKRIKLFKERFEKHMRVSVSDSKSFLHLKKITDDVYPGFFQVNDEKRPTTIRYIEGVDDSSTIHFSDGRWGYSSYFVTEENLAPPPDFTHEHDLKKRQWEFLLFLYNTNLENTLAHFRSEDISILRDKSPKVLEEVGKAKPVYFKT